MAGVRTLESSGGERRASPLACMKLQYLGHLMQRADSLEKTLMLRKIEGWKRRE